jgi:hypothetical protein
MLASITRSMLLPPVPVGSAALHPSAPANSAPSAIATAADAAETVVAPTVSARADELSDEDLEHVVGGLARSFIPPILARGDSHVVSSV